MAPTALANAPRYTDTIPASSAHTYTHPRPTRESRRDPKPTKRFVPAGAATGAGNRLFQGIKFRTIAIYGDIYISIA